MSILHTDGTPAQPQNGHLPSSVVASTTLSWDQVMSGDFPRPCQPTDSVAPATEPPGRAAFRQAVAQAATALRQRYPQLGGRITSAVKIVLAGDIEPGADGKFTVGSASDAGLHYVVDGACACKDSERPGIGGLCKHVLAAAIFQQAYAQTAQTLAQRDVARQSTFEHMVEESTPMEQPTPPPQAPMLPEAPYSASFKAIKHGFEVQITIRKAQSEEFLQTLATMPQWLGEQGYQPTRYAPTARKAEDTPTATEPKEGWCAKHQVQMTKQSNAKGSWWSHKTADDWCKGK